jgi:hypothetical protein
MTSERLFEEATLPALGRVRRGSGAIICLGAALLLWACGGSGHGTMMAHLPDGGAGGGSPGGAGAGGARLDAGADASISDASDGGATGDGPPNDSPIRINVTVDRCPTVLAAATPSMTTLDRPVALDATAGDADGDALTYLWSAPWGKFAMPAAASTTYTCAQAGEVMLTVTVSDRRCEGQASVPFTCLSSP